MDALTKEFNSERNRVKREAYRANHTREQKEEVLEKWKAFMKEVSNNYPFFEYFEKHFKWHKKSCVITKTNQKLLPNKDAPSSSKPEIVRSSHPPQETLVKKEPVTSSSNITLASNNPKLNVLEAYESSSSSSRTSSGKEKEQLDD